MDKTVTTHWALFKDGKQVGKPHRERNWLIDLIAALNGYEIRSIP